MSADDISARYSEEELQKAAERISNIPDDQIDYSDIPELTERDFLSAVPGRMLFYRAVKKPVTMRLDADVIAWLKSKGPGYQTLANRILRFEMCRDLVSREREHGTTRKPAARNGATGKRTTNGKPRRRA
jgi:uncharacterized protein (DUF4415 family)